MHRPTAVTFAICAILAAAILALTACQPVPAPIDPQQDPTRQPLGASITAPTSRTEPSAAALRKLIPYFDQITPAAVPELDMTPFRACLARAVYGNWPTQDQQGFEQIVADGRIYDNAVIAMLTNRIDRETHTAATRQTAGGICPEYAKGISGV